jgi:hypothetical protein
MLAETVWNLLTDIKWIAGGTKVRLRNLAPGFGSLNAQRRKFDADLLLEVKVVMVGAARIESGLAVMARIVAA